MSLVTKLPSGVEIEIDYLSDNIYEAQNPATTRPYKYCPDDYVHNQKGNIRYSLVPHGGSPWKRLCDLSKTVDRLERSICYVSYRNYRFIMAECVHGKASPVIDNTGSSWVDWT